MSTGRRAGLIRLRGRSIAELRDRARQAAVVLYERAGFGDRAELSASDLYASLGSAVRAQRASFADWTREFRQRGGREFFAGCEDPRDTARIAQSIDPDGVALVVNRAERILAGRFDLLALENLSFGDPVDWHLDPALGVRAPMDHWSRIPYLDPAIAGDHKRIWELNRHQWLVTLAQAWWHTGDERFAARVSEMLTAWMDANPPKRGVNWSSSLEIALRTISWLWTLRLLGAHRLLSDAVVARAVGFLVLNARHIERNLSTWFSPNTHLTGEALALYYVGLELRDFSVADRWRDLGRRILLECLPRHVRSDGTYFEQATWYHRYTHDFYLHFCLLEERAQHTTRPEVCDAVGRLATVMGWIMRSDGTMPLIGDDDGGRLLYLDGRSAGDVWPALANAAVLARSAELRALAGRPSAELAWLMGGEGLEHFRSMQSALPAATSRLFPAGGLAVLRDGWGPYASVMSIDGGPHGVLNGGHAHADALAFDLAVRGEPLFVDPGTCAYTVDATIRDSFRHTASHNAATVDGEASSQMTGPFSWGTFALTALTSWVSSPGADFFGASHDGFLRLPCAAHYRRDIVFVRRGLWLIRDSIEAASEADLEVHFQCAASITTERVSETHLVLYSDGKALAEVRALGDALRLETALGAVSTGYGARREAPRLTMAGRRRTASQILTLVSAHDLALQSVRAEVRGSGVVVWIDREAESDLIGLGHAAPVEVEGIGVDGGAFWVHRARPGGEVLDWAACGCRELRAGGAILHQSPDPRDTWDNPAVPRSSTAPVGGQ